MNNMDNYFWDIVFNDNLAVMTLFTKHEYFEFESYWFFKMLMFQKYKTKKCIIQQVY